MRPELLREGLGSITEGAVEALHGAGVAAAGVAGRGRPGAAGAGDRTTTTRRSKESPEALAYLQARGLVYRELIERFRWDMRTGPGPSVAEEEPQGRGRDPRRGGADRDLPGERARALQRLLVFPILDGGGSHRDLRPEDIDV